MLFKKVSLFTGLTATILASSCSHYQARTRLPASAIEPTCLDLAASLIAPTNSIKTQAQLRELYSVVVARKQSVAYPEIAQLDQMRLLDEPPAAVVRPTSLSPGLESADFEEAREIGGVFDDYKTLSDAKPLDLAQTELDHITRQAHEIASSVSEDISSLTYRRAYLKHVIEKSYSFEKDLLPQDIPAAQAQWSVKVSHPDLNTHHESAFDYVENYWKNLIRKTPEQTSGSIIPLPYEFVVANASRFDEMYYWDTYFGMQGLLATGRLDLSQKIVENFLYMIQNYGIIPNGNRDYYLTRSQPPFVSSMVREVYEATLKAKPQDAAHTKKWLGERAYPLLKRDFESFWMKPNVRFDEKTGLHHHFDDVNHARPERHSADKELADDWDDDHGLGITYQDTRAVAESGLDFTDGLGKEASQTANTLLNSMIYKYMIDLRDMALELGLESEAKHYDDLALKKKAAMDKYLWNSELGSYQNYLIEDGRNLDGLHAEIFTALFAKVASDEQAKEIVEKLRLLEKDGGVMSSLFTESHHQWDGDNGWAPLHYFIIQGLKNYGYDADAERIAVKLANSYAQIHHHDGVFLERIDVSKGARPFDDDKKYPVQEGFLWTNGVYTWIMTKVLGQSLEPLAD